MRKLTGIALVLAVSGCSGASDGAAADTPPAEGAAAAVGRSAAAQRAQRSLSSRPSLVSASVRDRFAARAVLVDRDGTEHVRLERYHRGLRVLGGDLVLHGAADGTALGASHTLDGPLQVEATARLGAEDAIAAARGAAQPHGATSVVGSELLVYARGGLQALAYEVRLDGLQEDGTPSELHLIIDAQSGALLEQWDGIETAAAAGTGRSFFNGTVALTTDLVGSTYSLRDPSRGNQYTTDMRNRTSGGAVFTDADNSWGDGTLANTQTIGVDAQYGTAVTWDYYKLVHGRSGIANNNAGAYNRVHYSRRYNNAFWSDSCFCMTYGDGDGTTFNPFDSLDVAGHEMTHGVTSRTANLIYSGESGGLNEGTSDIFGTMVEFYAGNASDPPDYLIGERLYKSGNRSLRSMIQPSSDGVSADCWYSGVGGLNVHYSSGVANHFYYLLAEGTAAGAPSRTCAPGDSRVASGAGTVAGIGRDKAEKIWYRALTTYFTSSTNYAAARVGTLAAAADLYGSGGPEHQAVAAAWAAVNVN